MDILTRDNLSIYHANMDLIYWLVCLSSRGGEGGHRGWVKERGRNGYLSQLQGLLLYMIIWCKIKVIINPMFISYSLLAAAPIASSRGILD